MHSIALSLNARPSRPSLSFSRSLVDLSCIRLTVSRFSQEISRGTPPTMFCTRFAGLSLLSATVSELTLRLSLLRSLLGQAFSAYGNVVDVSLFSTLACVVVGSTRI
jgi:hypothetical protein